MKTKCYSYENGRLSLYSECREVYKHPYAVIFSNMQLTKELLLSLMGLNEAKIEVYGFCNYDLENGVSDEPESYKYDVFLSNGL